MSDSNDKRKEEVSENTKKRAVRGEKSTDAQKEVSTCRHVLGRWVRSRFARWARMTTKRAAELIGKDGGRRRSPPDPPGGNSRRIERQKSTMSLIAEIR